MSFNWLFVDLNSFFASCEQQENPDWRGKPIGVVPLMADTTCCLAASYEAKAFGVKTGTGVADARARCPGIRFVLARHNVYTRYHHKIIEAVDRCLPVHKVLSIDEMICRLSGSQTRPDQAVALAHQVKASIRTHAGTCLTSSIGLATNPFLAKLASDMQKPDGLTLLPKNKLPEALHRLRLTDLPGVGNSMEARLNQQGIHTMEELCRLSRSDMRTIWGGIVGERFHDWLRGEETTESSTHHRSLGHQHVLEPALRTENGAWSVAKKLLVKAAARLRDECYLTRRVCASIKYMGTLYWAREIKVEETQDTLKLLTALRSIWPPSMAEKPLRISITFVDLIPETRHQLPLFENPKRENLGKTMDRIQERFGKDSLSIGSLYQFKSAAPTRISFSRVPSLKEFD